MGREGPALSRVPSHVLSPAHLYRGRQADAGTVVCLLGDPEPSASPFQCDRGHCQTAGDLYRIVLCHECLSHDRFYRPVYLAPYRPVYQLAPYRLACPTTYLKAYPGTYRQIYPTVCR